MQMIRFNHEGELLGLSREMDRFLNVCSPVRGTRPWAPATDVSETEDGFALRLDVPGFDREKVKVSVFGDTLTVAGEREGASEEKKVDWHRRERFHGTFERSFNFKTQLDSARVKASYKDGVLKISVPKAESAKPKEIAVELDS